MTLYPTGPRPAKREPAKRKRIARRVRIARVSAKRGQVIKADREWAEKVKLFGVCELGYLLRDCEGGLDAHHVFGKRAFPRLRYSITNGSPLCRKHHQFAHQNPDMFRLWWSEKHPAEFNRLSEMARRESRLS